MSSTGFMAPHYKYTRIDLATDAIRLIKLHKGDDSQPIKCEIFETHLHETKGVPYEALSYVWGTNRLQHSIWLDGCQLGVGANLYEALVHLRLLDKDRVLWVDAICIDQNHDAERGHQVNQMRHIYETAERVIIWLGTSNCEIDYLFDWIVDLDQQVLAKPQPHTINTWEYTLWCIAASGEQTLPDKVREALNSLLQRDWFSRIWVLQEAALAKSALITCGWKHANSRAFTMIPALLNIDCGEGVQARLEILPGLLRTRSRCKGSPLMTLLQKFGKSKATDPRDIVYALLGLSGGNHSSASELLRPNYQLSVQEVVQRSIAYLMLQTQDLSEQMSIQSLPNWNMDEFLDSLHDLPFYIFQWATDYAEDTLLYDLIISQTKKHNIQRIQQYCSCTGPHGPPITIALRRKNYALATLLLQIPGVDITTRDSNNRSPLSTAVAHGNILAAHWIREYRRIDVQETDPDHAALLVAAKKGRRGLAKLSLKNRRLGTSVRNFSGETLLLTAAKQGDLAVVESILRYPEIARRVSREGWPVAKWHRARWPALENPRWEGILGTYKDVDSISSRLKQQSFERPRSERQRARAKGLGKLTPFESALVNGLLQMIDKDEPYTRRAVHKAVKKSRFATLRGYVDLEALLADAGWFGCRTPVGACAQAGNMDNVSFLLNNGAEINSRDCDERAATPIWNAASHGHTDTVRLLIERGADIELMANEYPIKTTPLWVAASNGYDDIVTLLIENGANIRKALTMACNPSR